MVGLKPTILYCFVAILFFGCFEPELTVNRNDRLLRRDRGIIYFENVPFSGIVNSQYQDGTQQAKQSYKSGSVMVNTANGTLLDKYATVRISKMVFKKENKRNGIGTVSFPE